MRPINSGIKKSLEVQFSLPFGVKYSAGRVFSVRIGSGRGTALSVWSKDRLLAFPYMAVFTFSQNEGQGDLMFVFKTNGFFLCLNQST